MIDNELRHVSNEDDVFAVASPEGLPRVLHVLEAAGGGTLRHLLDILETVDSVEHHVVIPPNEAVVVGHHASSTTCEPVRQILSTGAIVHRLQMVRNPLHPANLASVRKLRKLIDLINPTIIHGHSSMGGAFVRTASVGRKVPVVYTPNGICTNKGVLLVERLLAPRTDRFIAVSESEGEQALDLHLASPEQLVVINNGIDPEPVRNTSYDLRHELGLAPNTTVIGTVARLVAQKAPEDFIRMCGEIYRSRPDVHFVLIGSGELQPKVDAEVKKAGIGENYHQITYLNDATVAIGQFDVCVLNSMFEGGPYTPLEAMRAGIPVVLTDVVGSRDSVEHMKSGLVYPFGDTNAMAHGVIELLANHQQRDDIIESARIRFKEKFDRQHMGEKHARCYAELVSVGR